MFKRILARKFTFEKGIYPEFDFGSDDPFSYDQIKSLADLRSPKRKNEMYDFLIKKLVNLDFEWFLKSYPGDKLAGMGKKERCSAYFKSNFAYQNGEISRLSQIFDCFIELHDAQNGNSINITDQEEKKNRSKPKYKKSMEVMRLNRQLTQRLCQYAEKGRDSQIVEFCNRIAVRDSIRLIEKIESDYDSSQSRGIVPYFERFKQALKSRTVKLPKYTMDVQYYSIRLLLKLEKLLFHFDENYLR